MSDLWDLIDDPKELRDSAREEARLRLIAERELGQVKTELRRIGYEDGDVVPFCAQTADQW